VILVVPPVTIEELIKRWVQIGDRLDLGDIRGVLSRAAPSRLLAMTFSQIAGYRFYVGKNVDAWSYKEALTEALQEQGSALGK
jgi:hypothetical protein